jgi:predicted nucleic acid-binding protein
VSARSLPASGQAVVIDASVWVSFLLPRDVNHLAAQVWLNAHVNSGGYIVAPLMLAVETGSAISRVVRDAAFAHSAVSDTYSFPYLSLQGIDQALIDEATNVAVTFRLKGSDSIYVALAKQLGVPLVSFDQEQLSRPASIIATIRP